MTGDVRRAFTRRVGVSCSNEIATITYANLSPQHPRTPFRGRSMDLERCHAKGPEWLNVVNKTIVSKECRLVFRSNCRDDISFRKEFTFGPSSCVVIRLEYSVLYDCCFKQTDLCRIDTSRDLRPYNKYVVQRAPCDTRVIWIHGIVPKEKLPYGRKILILVNDFYVDSSKWIRIN